MSFDRDKIWGPNRSAVRREKSRPRLVNDAIDTAGRYGSRTAELFFDSWTDAQEMTAYINANSKYEAKAEEVKQDIVFAGNANPDLPLEQRLIRAGFQNLEQVLDKYFNNKYCATRNKPYRVVFTLPVVPEATLIEYEKKCKEHARHREEEMERLMKLQRNGASGWRGGYGGNCNEVLCVDTVEAVAELPEATNGIPDPTNE